MSDPDNQLSSVLYLCRDGLIAVGALSMAVNLLVLTVSGVRSMSEVLPDAFGPDALDRV